MGERYFENPYKDYSDTLPVLIDEKFTKFIESLIEKNVKLILENTNPNFNKDDARADIYVGLSGISYMFLKLSQSNVNHKFDAVGLSKAYSDCANDALEASRASKPISFLSGNAGVHAVSAVVNKSDEDLNKFLSGVSIFEDPSYLDDGADEMLVGRSGYLLGLAWLQQQLQREILPKEETMKLSSIIIQSGRKYAAKHKKKVPLMFQFHGREYLGAAHGVSAILLSLLTLPTNDSKDLEDVKATIDEILKLQDETGNFPSKFDKNESHLVHWCHGAPGVVYLMAKAYLKFRHEEYLEACLKCGDLVWNRGLLSKGPGICHGIAGNGYVHLLLYRLTYDDIHLYRAMKFAEFLENEEFIQEARTPDRPFSLFEGTAGTVCFLIDLLRPNKASFPFMGVFDN